MTELEREALRAAGRAAVEGLLSHAPQIGGIPGTGCDCACQQCDAWRATARTASAALRGERIGA